jgi:hypothetical protein
METISSQLQQTLENYIDGKVEFPAYYPGMNILVSDFYKEQLKSVLKLFEKDQNSAKSFHLYLDTVIINMQTKIKKYKQSVYFNDENIKDIENQGYTIPFYIDENKKLYVLLGIIKKS